MNPVAKIGQNSSFCFRVEYLNVRCLSLEQPIGYSNISLSLYLEAELIAGTSVVPVGVA